MERMGTPYPRINCIRRVADAPTPMVVSVKYLMTDDRVQRIRQEPVRVAYDGNVLTVQASERLSRLELFERRAELEVLLGDEVVVYIARDSAEQRLFRPARMFDVGILGFGSNTLKGGIHAALGQH
jgi:hypothetical protein